MAKTTKEKPVRRKSPTKEPMLESPPPAAVSEDVIAKRAFEFYCGRGGQHGHDLQDWLQAEQEVRLSG